MASTVSGVLLTGNHAGRPSSGVTAGTLYACSTHSLIYQTSDTGSTWATWATLTGTGYTPGGTDVALADGGTGASLTDPNADRILFWDDSAGQVTWLTASTNLTITGTNITAAGGSGGTPILALDYNLASDHSGASVTANTFFDVISNQNFTVTSGSSLVEVIVRGFGFFNDTANQQYLGRINIDSAGTPIYKYFGSQNVNTTANNRVNALDCASVYISGLSAATHTIKIQVTSQASNSTFFCRASSSGPTTGVEFLNVQVIEHI